VRAPALARVAKRQHREGELLRSGRRFKASYLAVRLHGVPELHMVLLLLRVVPVLETDPLSGPADDPERKAFFDCSGHSANEPIGHAYGGDLVTGGVLHRPIHGVSDRISVELHRGGHHRGGIPEVTKVGRRHIFRCAGPRWRSSRLFDNLQVSRSCAWWRWRRWPRR